ncbi:MAG: MxaK protein [Xanthomonadaceae bacterium]|nr:MxaK protein [Xanthomonadaceae bacterium]
MKRTPIHLAFGGVSLALAGTALALGLQLRAAEHANALIAEAAAFATEAAQVKAAGEAAGQVATLRTPPLDSPEAALAFALALAQGGDYDRALKALETLSQSPRDDIRLIARYDLGNLHLRQAKAIGDEQVAKGRTLVELGKQAYRRVLDEDPQHWEARYNLERALWLEPEADDGNVEVTPPPAVERPNGDKPELP